MPGLAERYVLAGNGCRDVGVLAGLCGVVGGTGWVVNGYMGVVV